MKENHVAGLEESFLVVCQPVRPYKAHTGPRWPALAANERATPLPGWRHAPARLDGEGSSLPWARRVHKGDALEYLPRYLTWFKFRAH